MKVPDNENLAGHMAAARAMAKVTAKLRVHPVSGVGLFASAVASMLAELDRAAAAEFFSRYAACLRGEIDRDQLTAQMAGAYARFYAAYDAAHGRKGPVQ